MVEILNFVPRQTAFDPEFVQVLASALDDAWNRIEETGSRFARPGYARAMREVIAKRVIETAQRGVEDSHALADDAVQFVMANYRDNCPNSGRGSTIKIFAKSATEAGTPNCARRYQRQAKQLLGSRRRSVQGGSLLTVRLHRLDFYVVLRKLIPKL